MNKGPHYRRAALTVLLVGEGDAEQAFLEHLKSLYVQRGSGVAVTIKNARGKGAEHVIDFAWRQKRTKDFDVIAALFDTDVGWHDASQAAAKKYRVFPLLCTPCLESLLLSIKGQQTEGFNTGQLKQRFKQHLGCEASALDMQQHFDLALIEGKLHTHQTLANVVHLLKTGKRP